MPSRRALRARLADLRTELGGVERWLRDLRHNRGRWPRSWCRGMIAHYETRRMKIRSGISRVQADLAKLPQPKPRR